MTDPVDRALEKLEVITEGNFDRIVRPILTDLVAETKSQQSPASDGGLDEIVQDAVNECGLSVYSGMFTKGRFNLIIHAACIRARETDPRLAAVEEYGLELSCRARKVDRRTGQRILALARGEGEGDD